VKLVRGVSGDIRCLAGVQDRFLATESHFDLTVENGKHLLKIVPVRWRASSGRDKHVNEAIAARRVLARQNDRVGIAD
jgi:hypothetical protein